VSNPTRRDALYESIQNEAVRLKGLGYNFEETFNTITNEFPTLLLNLNTLYSVLECAGYKNMEECI